MLYITTQTDVSLFQDCSLNHQPLNLHPCPATFYSR